MAPFYFIFMIHHNNLVNGGNARKLTPLDDSLPPDDEVQKYDMALKMTSKEIFEITKATPTFDFVMIQQIKWYGHIARSPNISYIKQLTFSVEKNKRKGQPLQNLRRVIKKRLIGIEEG